MALARLRALFLLTLKPLKGHPVLCLTVPGLREKQGLYVYAWHASHRLFATPPRPLNGFRIALLSLHQRAKKMYREHLQRWHV